MKILKKDKKFIELLITETRIENILNIFDCYGEQYKKCRLIYFNIGENSELYFLKNKKISGYSIMGVADYDKAFIFDNRNSSKLRNIYGIGQVINLDLNVLTYLKNIVNGRNIQDKENFIKYLRYLKDLNYCPNMSISLCERVSQPINLEVWSDYVLSFVKYESLSEITETSLKDNYVLPESKYKWAKNIMDESSYEEEQFNQFYATACLICKSFILKMQDIETEKKLLELLEYSLEELNIYLEFELFLMFKYLIDDKSVQRAFSKIQSISKTLLERIKNITWDILHIRFLENQMINDLKKESIIFHYIGTKDVGLQEITNLNPLKLIGFLDNQSIMVRENNITDVFFTKQMEYMLQRHNRKNSISRINYNEKFSQISEEIVDIVNTYFLKNK